jgi:molybdopterin-synthase adenylyltransferase
MPIFSPEEMARYDRQMLLPGVGFKGQQKLKDSSVLIVGAGGLGSPALLYLAAAGVGRIGIIDGDRVDASNLHRQIVHSTASVGQGKTASAAARLREVNPQVEVVEHAVWLRADNALEIIRPYDFVLEGSDNFPTKFLVNDACILLNKPFSHAGMLRFEGQLFTVLPKQSRCYRCLFREPPPEGSVPNCAEAGVLGALPGVIGCLQATEALKYLLGLGDLLADRMLLFDALTLKFREIKGKRDKTCPICGDHPTRTALEDLPFAAC